MDNAPSGNHSCGYGPDGMCDVCKALPENAQRPRSTAGIAAMKAQAAAERDAKRRAAKARRRWHRRCFWTRPLGHLWTYRTFGYRTCEACGKEAMAHVHI